MKTRTAPGTFTLAESDLAVGEAMDGVIWTVGVVMMEIVPVRVGAGEVVVS